MGRRRIVQRNVFNNTFEVAPATFSHDFLTMGLPSLLTGTRASSATAFTQQGQLVTYGTDVMRQDFDPSTARTNWVRNGNATGGGVGTAPTNWSHTGITSGITRTPIGPATYNGVSGYIYEFTGTASASNGLAIAPETVNGIFGLAGQTWTGSVYALLVTGSLSGVSAIQVRVEGTDGAARTELLGTVNAMSGLSTSLQRFSTTQTLANGSTVNTRPLVEVNWNSGSTLSFRIFIAWPQMERSGSVTDYIPTTSAAATVCNPRGLLLEEARTNSIRNGGATGATVGVVGSGGALPTNWNTTQGAGGLTTEIIATGTELGVPYVDVKISGTSAGTAYNLAFDTAAQIAATLNSVWSGSFWVKIVSGGLTNITTVEHSIRQYTAAGAFLETAQATTFTPTSTLTRQLNQNATASNASVERVHNLLRLNFSSAVAIDVTLRLGGCQLEQGPYATSYIPTTTAAATRASDLVVGSNLAALGFNQVEGTFVIGVEQNYTPVASRFEHFLSVSIGTSTSNTLLMLKRHTSGVIRAEVRSGGVDQTVGALDVAGVPAGIFKQAFAYRVNDFANAANGSSVFTDTSGDMPVGTLDRISLGTRSGVTGDINQAGQIWVRTLEYTPVRQADSALPVRSA